MTGRCALCRCRAAQRLYGIKVCTWHVSHGEADPPCPYCSTSRLFDPRWTYTVNGEKSPLKVQVRQVSMPNTIFLDRGGDCVLELQSVLELAPRGWPTKTRRSVVMIGLGVQLGTTFTITQWGSDWERELFDAARPSLALVSRVFTVGWSNPRLLAGVDTRYREHAVPWPTIDVTHKIVDVRRTLIQQAIRSHARPFDDIGPNQVMQYWAGGGAEKREAVWRHNYFNTLDTAMRVFQIEWPADEETAHA